MKELGLGDVALTFEATDQPGRWRLIVTGHRAVTIMCSPGTTTQFVRNQIFDQLQGS